MTRLCSRIEATDSLAFSQWTVINPLTGQVVWQTDWQPELLVYMLEPESQLKTESLSRMTVSRDYDITQSQEFLARFQEACQTKDLSKLGDLATTSALVNDRRLPKPYLQELIALASQCRALGVNVAHSGTVIGILFVADDLIGPSLLEGGIKNSPMAAYYSKRRLCRLVYQGVHQY